MLGARERGWKISTVTSWLFAVAVLGVEVQLDFAAGALFGRVHDAGIERAGIDVQAYSTFIEFPGIHHAMDRVCRIHCAGLGEIHLDSVERLQLATAAR